MGARQLITQIESRGWNGPPPAISPAPSPSAKALAKKFERMAVAGAVPSPKSTAPVPLCQPRLFRGEGGGGGGLPPPAAAPSPPPTMSPCVERAAPPPLMGVPIAPVKFAASGTLPRSAPPPPCHGPLALPSAAPVAAAAPVVVAGSVFPRGQSTVAVAARMRELESDDDEDDQDDDRRRDGMLNAGLSPSPARLSVKSLGQPANTCPKCGKSVYHAERVVGLGGVDWHRGCLRCVDCNRTLASVADVTDHKGQIFCKVRLTLNP